MVAISYLFVGFRRSEASFVSWMRKGPCGLRLR